MGKTYWAAVVAAAFTAAVVAAAFTAAVAAAFAAAVAAAFTAAVAAAFAAAFTAEDNSKKSAVLSGISILISAFSFILSSGTGIDWSFILSWACLGLFIILLEVFFLLDKKQPNSNESRVLFALKRKVPAALYSALTIVGGTVLVQLVKNYWLGILKWIGYIGAGAIVMAAAIGLIYLWLRLNALKYSSVQKSHVGRPKGLKDLKPSKRRSK